MKKTLASATLVASAVAGGPAKVFILLADLLLNSDSQESDENRESDQNQESDENQRDLCADIKADMTSLGEALVGDEKKAYDQAYLSCIDLKKRKCLLKGYTDEEANKKWTNIVIDLFKYETDLDQNLLRDRTFYVNCGNANALAGSLIAVALAIYAITF